MEFARKRLLSNKLHFGSVKQHKYFHIPKYVVPFQIRYLSFVHYLEGFIEKLSLEKDEAVTYDPHVMISQQIQKIKNSIYELIPRPDLVRISNKYSWEEVEKVLKDSIDSSDHNQVARQIRWAENMEIDQDDQTPQAKRKRIDSIEEAKELDLNEIDVEVSKQVDEIDKKTNFLGKTLTILIPYPSLDFIVPQKSKSITLTVLILVQTNLQVVYMEIKKSSVHNVNEDKMHSIPTNKILLRVADSFNDTF